MLANVIVVRLYKRSQTSMASIPLSPLIPSPSLLLALLPLSAAVTPSSLPPLFSLKRQLPTQLKEPSPAPCCSNFRTIFSVSIYGFYVNRSFARDNYYQFYKCFKRKHHLKTNLKLLHLLQLGLLHAGAIPMTLLDDKFIFFQ